MARHPKIEAPELPVDRTLRRFVVLFRVLAWMWMALLVVAVPGSDPGANLVIVAAAMGLATLGMATAVWASSSWPRLFAKPWYAIADAVVALVVGSASTIAGAQNLFHGGYPISTIFFTAYAFNIRIALVTAGALVVDQVVVQMIDESGLLPLLGSVVFFVMAIMVGWVFDNLRAQDRARLEVEDKLDQARAERIRHEERIELANRLHDSVVQTLIALRRDADDPDRVRYLARRQERQMRQTISEFRSPFRRSARGKLQRICDDIEDIHGVEIDAVFRGDARLDDKRDAVLAVAREALVNAAKHSGADTIDLYGEFDEEHLHLFVRDRGSGFDPDAVDDGHGQSLPERATTVGATATLSSQPGEGTEVEILWKGP